MIYVYTPQPSHSARLLATTLRGKRLRFPRRLRPTDVVVNWGSRKLSWILDQGNLVLNPLLEASKKVEIFALRDAKLPTPPLSLKKEGPDWFGRSAFHSHGRDFLRPPAQPAFFVQRLSVVEEYRIHVFNYDGKHDIRILRWGRKVPRGAEAHEWVRSDDAGWRIAYGEPSQQLPKGLRHLAKVALAALQYDWGAVDLGLTSDRRPVIFEVNSAPGLDEGGRTIQLYAAAIMERLGKGGVS